MISDFWGKKDEVSMARSLRLAAIKNVLDQELISKEDAKYLLTLALSPGDETTVYDDSDCIDI